MCDVRFWRENKNNYFVVATPSTFGIRNVHLDVCLFFYRSLRIASDRNRTMAKKAKSAQPPNHPAALVIQVVVKRR